VITSTSAASSARMPCTSPGPMIAKQVLKRVPGGVRTETAQTDPGRMLHPVTTSADAVTPAAMAALRDLHEAQRDTAGLAAETAALRREAAEILGRSRWYSDDRLRELLLRRTWYGPRLR
jgi:hypothetical protein